MCMMDTWMLLKEVEKSREVFNKILHIPETKSKSKSKVGITYARFIVIHQTFFNN